MGVSATKLQVGGLYIAVVSPRSPDPRSAKLARTATAPPRGSHDLGKRSRNQTLNPDFDQACLRSANIVLTLLTYKVDLIHMLNYSVAIKK